ncbi:hypothetical protein IAU60_006330 [Kwoniella sp. DSM 27419]
MPRASRINPAGGRVNSRFSRKTRIVLSYAPDWALTILLWGIFYLLDKINGYRRLFSVTDTSLAHPYADPERIPVWLLAVLCGVVPAIVIIITAPDFFDRCQLPEDLTSNPVHGLTSWTACTQTDDSIIQEGFRSFPSGHSSFAWAGMWYMILFLAAKMRINNRSGYTWKSWLLLAPLSCSTLVSISRTMDYRHHATDVIAGAVIGLLFSWYAYRQYYPPLEHVQSYKPYSPRIPKDEVIPMHHRPHRASTEGMIRPGTESHHYPSDVTGNTSQNGEATFLPGQGQPYGQSLAWKGAPGDAVPQSVGVPGWSDDHMNAGDHGEAEETVQRVQ